MNAQRRDFMDMLKVTPDEGFQINGWRNGETLCCMAATMRHHFGMTAKDLVPEGLMSYGKVGNLLGLSHRDVCKISSIVDFKPGWVAHSIIPRQEIIDVLEAKL